MTKVTLDKNCLVDLEDGRPGASSIKRLIELHDSGQISVRLPAIMASEKLRDGTYANNFSGFEEWLKKLRLSHLELLSPLAYHDITYFDRCVLGDEKDDFEERIHTILFPEIEFRFAVYCQKRGIDLENCLDVRWRNAKCDVLSMWCHVIYSGDVFVSSDSNFHKATKKQPLIRLGGKAIMYPSDAVSHLA